MLFCIDPGDELQRQNKKTGPITKRVATMMYYKTRIILNQSVAPASYSTESPPKMSQPVSQKQQHCKKKSHHAPDFAVLRHHCQVPVGKLCEDDVRVSVSTLFSVGVCISVCRGLEDNVNTASFRWWEHRC